MLGSNRAEIDVTLRSQQMHKHVDSIWSLCGLNVDLMWTLYILIRSSERF